MIANESLVSVVIPVYNGERYLTEAIESVLAQTYEVVEIIVVNDGSTDNTADIARQFVSVRYYEQANSGLSTTRNNGIKRAQGEFLAFLDHDDLWLPDKLTLQMEAFESDPKLDMVFGHVEQFYSPELKENKKIRLNEKNVIMPGYLSGTILVKRSSFFQVGSFDTSLRVGEFVDWYARAKEQGGQTFMLPDIVARRRIHSTNMGIRERHARNDYVRILKASLDRRRKL